MNSAEVGKHFGITNAACCTIIKGLLKTTINSEIATCFVADEVIITTNGKHKMTKVFQITPLGFEYIENAIFQASDSTSMINCSSL